MEKILVVHTNYKNIGGEDIAVANEINSLKTKYEVMGLYYKNDLKNFVFQLIAFLTNKNVSSIKKFKQTIKYFNPDIIYIHNTWFKASPFIINEAFKLNIPIILKLHNFRLFCGDSYLIKNHVEDETICLACGKKGKKFGFFNDYFNKNFIKSIFLIWHNKKLIRFVNKFNVKVFTLTNFQKNYFINKNVIRKNIYVQRNFSNEKSEVSIEYNPNSSYIVYSGRISREKGVEFLIKNFLDSNLKNINLKILGDGPLLVSLKKTYNNDSIEFIGEKNNLYSRNLIAKSRALVTCTTLYEGHPTIFTEAIFSQVPVIFPDNGGLKEFFPENYDLVYDGSSIDLKTKLRLLDSEETLLKISQNNKQYYFNNFSNSKLLENFSKIINYPNLSS